jgi:molybdate transport system substrate-binding protein
MTVRRLVATGVGLALLAGCSASATASDTPSQAAEPVALTIYGAASLKDALAAVKAAYEAAVPGVTLTIASDSSATLRTQIEQGAPADVFLSSDQQNPGTLVDAGQADGAAVDFAGNLLTIIVPSDNPAGIEAPADLGRPGVKVVAAGDEVPVTRYAELVVTNLAADPGYPTGFAASYAANVVSKEENVKAVVAKIELGEGDAAIVYATDATAAEGVATIEIPAAANIPAMYAGVVVAASSHVAEAHAFLDWLAGPHGRSTLGTFGFLPPS